MKTLCECFLVIWNQYLNFSSSFAKNKKKITKKFICNSSPFFIRIPSKNLHPSFIKKSKNFYFISLWSTKKNRYMKSWSIVLFRTNFSIIAVKKKRTPLHTIQNIMKSRDSFCSIISAILILSALSTTMRAYNEDFRKSFKSFSKLLRTKRFRQY